MKIENQFVIVLVFIESKEILLFGGKKKKEEEARSKGYNGLNFQMGLGWIMIHEFCSLPKLFVCSESRDTLKAIL